MNEGGVTMTNRIYDFMFVIKDGVCSLPLPAYHTVFFLTYILLYIHTQPVQRTQTNDESDSSRKLGFRPSDCLWDGQYNGHRQMTSAMDTNK